VRRVFLLAAAAVLAGCGGSSHENSTSTAPKLTPLVTQGPLNSGPEEVWFYAARGKPRSLVIFLHGYGGPTEETPANHLPWLKHLAAMGSDVVYPRYEMGGSPDPFPNIQTAVKTATEKLGNPHVPVVVIGYSRGGRIAVDYAALRAANGHEPSLVLTVFPAVYSQHERLVSFKHLDSKLRLAIMLGDKDTSVGGEGARAILARLELADFPPSRIKLIPIRSHGRFKATHLSLLDDGAAARRAFWRPTDRLIDSIR
jgi:pimeloyl-ACP methyl ester carboxylesterase